MIGVIGGILGAIAAIYLMCGFRVVRQYERGVKFTLGRYTATVGAGLRYILPMFQTMEIVDIRQRVIDLPAQEVMTKDQVNLKIDGVVFYNVTNAASAVINVESIKGQLIAKATSELKEILGNKTMKESLADREDIASKLGEQLSKAIQDPKLNWGIEVKGVQINNILLPEELTRAMAKVAEANQEKEARVVKANGELQASEILRKAASEFAKDPNAMRLRELQTYAEIGTEENTLMLVIPSNLQGTNFAVPALISEGLNQSRRKGKKKDD